MSELKLRGILSDVKSKNPQKRLRALQKLYEFDLNNKGKEISIYLLTDVIKTAAHPFGEPVDHWDQPSHFLLQFVSDYKDVNLTKTLINHYSSFSPAGKNIVLNYLCEFDLEHCRQAVLHIYREELKTNQAIFPVNGLYDRPLWLAEILTNFTPELIQDTYRNYFYHALLFCLKKGHISRLKNELITHKLAEDFEHVFEKMQGYIDSYSTEAVYKFWKNNYLLLREKINLYLSLMEYFANEETDNFIKKSLALKDPTVQVKAVTQAFHRNIPVEETILTHCAEHIETSEMLYHELVDLDKESIYPIKEKKQHYFAKSHLFQHLIYETDYEEFPSDFRIVDSVETENYYGQPIRFYLVAFSADEEEELVGWVGAYSLEAGEDNVHMWEGTYTNFDRLNEFSIEEHIKRFMKNREQRNETQEKEVYFDYKPSFSAGFQGFCVIVFLQWFGVLASPTNMIFVLPLTVIALWLAILKIIERKNVSVKIEGHKLIYQTSRKIEEILLHEIKSVKNTKGKIEIYSRENKLALTIKKKHIDEKPFFCLIQGLTDHLKEPPIIK
jgi:hypothetical protein